jgi:hypothetical protein
MNEYPRLRPVAAGRFLNSAIFIIFAFSFAKPQSTRDWRSFGAFSAFLVALFTEMYGFPLTIYLLSGWLTSKFPGVDWFAHDSGHLLEMIFGWKSNPHFGPSTSSARCSSSAASGCSPRPGRCSTPPSANAAWRRAGPYARIRHPQYAGFVLVMFGFLLQWPTIPTVVMFPVLVIVYARLARREEAEVAAEFSEEYAAYRVKTPALWPW